MVVVVAVVATTLAGGVVAGSTGGRPDANAAWHMLSQVLQMPLASQLSQHTDMQSVRLADSFDGVAATAVICVVRSGMSVMDDALVVAVVVVAGHPPSPGSHPRGPVHAFPFCCGCTRIL